MASTQEPNPKGDEKEATKEEEKDMSLEEISNYRAIAQQNSLDAIKAAEERYNRAKESLKETTEAIKEYAQQTASLAAEKGKKGMELAYEAAKDMTVKTGKNEATPEEEKEETVEISEDSVYKVLLASDA